MATKPKDIDQDAPYDPDWQKPEHRANRIALPDDAGLEVQAPTGWTLAITDGRVTSLVMTMDHLDLWLKHNNVWISDLVADPIWKFAPQELKDAIT